MGESLLARFQAFPHPGTIESVDRDAPSRRMRAAARLRPFEGRADKLEDLDRWLGDDAPLSVCVLHGPAGAGKTRLLVEWVALLRARGVRAEFLSSPYPVWETDEVLAGTAPRVFVIDDADLRGGHIRSLVHEILEPEEEGPRLEKIRIVALARRRGGWWSDLLHSGPPLVRETLATCTIRRSLDPLDRARGVPLGFLEEQIRALGGAQASDDAGSAWFRLERDHWLGAARTSLSMAEDHEAACDLIAGSLAVFTLLGGGGATEILNLVSHAYEGRTLAKPIVEFVLTYLAQQYPFEWRTTHMAPLRPAQLGELLVDDVLTRTGASVFDRLFLAAKPWQQVRWMTVLLRVVNRRLDAVRARDLGREAFHSTLANCEAVALMKRQPRMGEPALIAATRVDGFPGAALLERHVRELSDPQHVGRFADAMLSEPILRDGEFERLRSLLADVLVSVGRSRAKDAERGPGLAGTMSGALPPEMRALAQQMEQSAAVARRRAVLPDLARALILRSELEPDGSKRQRELSDEAIAMWRELQGADEPEVRVSLAVALLKRANQDVDGGEPREALARAEESARLLREAVETSPALHLAALSGALMCLASCQKALGLREQSLASSDEAVEVGRRIARIGQEPDRLPLAVVLAHAGALPELGRDSERAETALREAVEVLEWCEANGRPEAIPRRSASLAQLGCVLGATGRLIEAEEHLSEAVELARRSLPIGWPVSWNHLAGRFVLLASTRAMAHGPEAGARTLAEAIAEIRPTFLEMPRLLAPSVSKLCQDYTMFCAQSSKRFDEPLLRPILTALQAIRTPE